MLRFIRIPRLRALVPRVSAPLLPVTGIRPGALTHAPRSGPRIRLFSHSPARLTTSPPPLSQQDPRTSLPKDATFSQRLKHLIKSYGWYALGMYAILGVLDFGVAFLGIQLIGADHVARFAGLVKDAIAGILHSKPAEPGMDEVDHTNGGHAAAGHEGLYAMIVLAYTVHKTLFLPLRVGLTAALTPRLVGWLSQRGWAGGAGTRRAAGEMREKMRQRRERSRS